jgi:protein tyrosine phosphatase
MGQSYNYYYYVLRFIECLSKSNHSTLRTLFHYCIAYLYSVGVGRTGTFIALDTLYEHGQETGYVDIIEYVQMMRKDRMNMIQTIHFQLLFLTPNDCLTFYY